MAVLPENVSKAWDNREGPVIFSTVDNDGKPNAIYATCVSKFDEEMLVVADNYFSKTQDNIRAGSTGSILFITPDQKAYQVKGPIEYHTEGAIFEDMKKWNPKKHPGHAAAALKVEEVYTGAEKLL
jgi:predicted pyridoxine 5'-phosphate oxidase superfamily flavin-nucleotide-binding protein